MVGLSVLEYLENKQINIPIGCPISTSIGMLNRKRFIYFMIDNFLLGQQAVTLATYLMKNSHINNIGMYIGSPASLQTYRKNNDYFENETDYRQNDDVSKLVIVNKFLAKSDDVDLQIIKLLDKNKSINYISKELFLGETTVKYRLLKLFGTQKLKYCRDVSRIIVEWITMHKNN